MSAEKTLCAPYWPEPIRVVSEASSPHGFVTIEAIGLELGQHSQQRCRLQSGTDLKSKASGPRRLVLPHSVFGWPQRQSVSSWPTLATLSSPPTTPW